MDRVRNPEQMLVTGFDENNKVVTVNRGYHGSLIGEYKKGSSMRVFRFLNSIGITEMDKEDVLQLDGTIEKEVLTESRLVYEFSHFETCSPGCYYLEFKLIKMLDSSEIPIPNPEPTISNDQFSDCDIGSGVEWVRRFPLENEGYLIQIIDSPTSEILFK
jgi:hypothetical protein